METIYFIIGGGQRVRQNVDLGQPTEIIKEENSDFVEKCKCHGADSFTNVMWSTDIDSVKRWARDWAGKEVEFELNF
jgi:hypothetical protein